MADVLRSNEGLRVELAGSQKKIIELRDTLASQQKTILELQASLKRLEEGAEEPETKRSQSWFASLLRMGRLGGENKRSDKRPSGCLSASCCFSLLGKWGLEFGQFLLSGVWDFFWDPVGWWREVKESLLAEVTSQLQVLGRLFGLGLMWAFINASSWGLIRIRSLGRTVRGVWQWFWGEPVFTLISSVVRWGIRRVRPGGSSQQPEQMTQVLKCMREMSRQIEQLQAQCARSPTRPVRETPAAITSPGGKLRKPCPNCGKAGHTLWECRAPKRCLNCKSTKHLARDCPQVRALDLRTEIPTARPPPWEEVADFTGEEEAVCPVKDLGPEGTAEGSRAPVLHVRAGIGSSRELVLIDTGSSVNVLPHSVAEAQGIELATDTQETQMRLKAFNGTSSEVLGTAMVSVTIGTWKGTLPFVVTDSCSSIILGMPALRDLDVKVDPARRRLEDRTGHLVLCQRAEVEAPAYSLEIASKN